MGLKAIERDRGLRIENYESQQTARRRSGEDIANRDIGFGRFGRARLHDGALFVAIDPDPDRARSAAGVPIFTGDDGDAPGAQIERDERRGAALFCHRIDRALRDQPDDRKPDSGVGDAFERC